MSFSNPRRRTMVTRSESQTSHELNLKTNMALRKGATFHSPPSPSLSVGGFIPPHLPRSQTHLDDISDARRRRIALTINDIDEALAKTEALSLSDKPNTKYNLRKSTVSLPRGFLSPPVVDPELAKKESERRVLRPRSTRRQREHASDSGLGSSVASTNDERVRAANKLSKESVAQTSPAFHTRSAALGATLPSLSRRAINRIHEHTLRPLLEKSTLADFQPIVLDVPRRIRSKEIICLRDLEKTLVFMAPEKAKNAAFYLEFCLTSIRCIQATVEYLTDREQVRPGDRPYTNGYFIDLKDQIYEYGKQLAAKEKGDFSSDMDIDQADEIRLHGGIAENGRPAELVRVKKDGTAISMATGKPVDLNEAPVKFKRSLSEQLEDDEEIMRSMARRKKNATPEELAPKKCREPGCTKEFKRPCDLTKHEKTHSRPFKCPIPTCKYHNYGWPTAKEMDRHVNDKHSDAPSMYECLFKPCAYKSKRESNCKQHMEKAHGWAYVRTKTNGKKDSSKAGSVTQQTPILEHMSTPSTSPRDAVHTPQDMHITTSLDFPAYNQNNWAVDFQVPAELELESEPHLTDDNSPSSSGSYDQFTAFHEGSHFLITDEEIYAAPVQIQYQQPTLEQFYKMNPQQISQLPNFQLQQQQQCGNQQPDLALQFSPTGQGNTMLYTPTSQDAETFDDPSGVAVSDFQLFPNTTGRGLDGQPLFGEVPSADLGFSQTTQPDFFLATEPSIEWQNFNF